MKIGIFDSGIGGLSVLTKIHEKYKGLEIFYVADTKRMPYGDKTKEEIIQYSKEITEFLLDKGVSLIIVACNTATANALDYLTKYNVKIYGIIQSAINELKEHYIDNKKIICLSTQATYNSKVYEKEIKKLSNIKSVEVIPAKTIVPLIENNEKEEILKNEVNKYLYNKDFDILVLACTHYPFIMHLIDKQNIEIIDPAIGLVKDIKNEIKKSTKDNVINFFTTSDPLDFKSKAEKILNEKISVHKIELGDK